ncbi:MAG: LacI family DNA-binding transcriptional regulator [Hyphomicrobiaceae bacterium]
MIEIEEDGLSDRVTLKSIAQDLGISHMTVSRALSDHPSVQPQTRAKVLRRAKELGYVKSAAAKAMRGDGMKIVGLMLPNITNEFYARFANELALACTAKSYQLIVHLTNDDAYTEQASLVQLREVQAHAVAMVPAPGQANNSGNRNLPHRMRVVQFIREKPADKPFASVLVDDRDALRDAVLHLAKMGHKSIAYIGGRTTLSTGRRRFNAYRRGLIAAGLGEDTNYVYSGPPTFEMGERHAEQILDACKATAIVCGGFEISSGALNAIMGRDISLNKDLAFVGYGDPSFYAWIGGGITTVHVPVVALAHRTAELLTLDTLSEAESLRTKTSLKAHLRIR